MTTSPALKLIADKAMASVVFLIKCILSSVNGRRIVKGENIRADSIAANEGSHQQHTNDEGCDKNAQRMTTT